LKNKKIQEKPAFVKAFEKDQTEEAKTMKTFKVSDFTAGVDEVKTEKIKGLGVVKYKVLTARDIAEIPEDVKGDQGLYLVYVMLHKADETVTFEEVGKLPVDVSGKLMETLVPKNVFLN
jgi:hypothetical protein